MKEQWIHEHVCRYIKYQYGDTVFWSDMSGIKLPIGLAKQVARMRSGSGIPDIFIAEPTVHFCGLFIEVKREEVCIFKKKDQRLSTQEHIRKQFNMLDVLNQKGFCALFGMGFQQCRNIIDAYMQNNLEYLYQVAEPYCMNLGCDDLWDR